MYKYSTNQALTFINGVLKDTQTCSSFARGSATYTLYLGKSTFSEDGLLHGYIAEFCISNGIARYSSNFDVPTTYMQTISYGKLLYVNRGTLRNVPGEESGEFKYVQEGNLRHAAFTESSIPSANPRTLKAGSKQFISYSLNGLKDYEHDITLELGQGSALYTSNGLVLSNARFEATTFPFTLGGSDFTVEVIYSTHSSIEIPSSTFFVDRIGFYASEADNGRWDYWYRNTSSVYYGENDRQVNTKYHLAISYVHNQQKVYVAKNGTIQLTATDVTIDSFTPSIMGIGIQIHNWHIDSPAYGILHAVRITKTAIYRVSYAVPTSLSSTSNTVFVLNF